MRNRLIKWVIISLGTVGVVLIIYISIQIKLFFDEPRVDRRVLIDSVGLHNNETLYWFYEADGLGDKGVTFVYIGKNVCDASLLNAVGKGKFVYEVTASNDTIYLTTSYGFETIKTHRNFILVNKKEVRGQKFRRNSLKDEIPFVKICQ